MYCHQCGEQLAENSHFCSQCGAKVQNQPKKTQDSNNVDTLLTDETAAGIEVEYEERRNPLMHYLPVLLPFFSLIIVSVILTTYYFQGTRINEEVVDLKNSADEAALSGNYQKAKEYLLKAQTKRPNYSVLETDLNAINEAIQYEQTLSLISEQIKKTQFSQASKELASLKDKLNRQHGPLFTPFYQQLDERNIGITVGTVKQELANLNSVDQLASKLSILASMPKKEASAVKEEIINKIVQFSIDEAEAELANKQFSDAVKIIDKGLQYAINNEKLLSLKERVSQEKAAFELAEQQRIEQAMEAAAQEDLKNRTAAVEVSDFSVEVDEYGDLYLTGSVKNVATKGITGVTVYYTIFDENDVAIDTADASVYPYELAPSAVGSFEDTYYGVNQNISVEIDNITWYLN
ncbi:zinc-ribbon domain-containing protein [Mesobacillus maritimus]|uniref:zinc-ribbon domain-containing protein n=1 Tax=Mesobacillus maritimus TaxID=1643336 RepID=UPI00384E72F7